MKKYLIVIGLALNVLVACTFKSEKREEEDAYNPYDTSELESYKNADTIYVMDSVIKTIRLKELK